MNTEKLKGHILILIANILFAVNMPISKYLLPTHLLPEALTIMRITFACVLFWLTSLFVKYEKVTLKDLGLLFICALCGIAFNQLFFIYGLNSTSPIDASIIAIGVPIYVMLLAAAILKEPITKMKAFGVLLGVFGALTLVLQSSHAATQTGSLKGNLMVVVSGLFFSIYLVISKPLTLRYSSVTIMKWMFLFGSIVLLPFMYKHVFESPAFNHVGYDIKEISAIAFVLFGATYIAYLLIPMALKRIRPTTVSMYNYVQPIIASFIAIWVGQDSFSINKLLSASLVFFGVYLVTQSKSKADLDREKEMTTEGEK